MKMIIAAAAFLLMAGCGGSAPPAQSTQSNPPAQTAKPVSSPPVARVAACSLFTTGEIQALLGRPVSEGRQEEMAELSTCQYQAPAPPPDILLTLYVFTGTEPGQAKGVYEIAKKNAAGVETVSGVGDEAYWDDLLRKLSAVKNNYQVDVTIASDLGGLKTARAVMEKLLPKLR